MGPQACVPSGGSGRESGSLTLPDSGAGPHALRSPSRHIPGSDPPAPSGQRPSCPLESAPLGSRRGVSQFEMLNLITPLT